MAARVRCAWKKLACDITRKNRDESDQMNVQCLVDRSDHKCGVEKTNDSGDYKHNQWRFLDLG